MKDRDFWSVGSVPWHLAACSVRGQGAKDRQPQACCLLCQTSLLRSLKVQRRDVHAPHTPPTNAPIQLKLVLLKEVGHFTSRHITFMWSHLSLQENEELIHFSGFSPSAETQSSGDAAAGRWETLRSGLAHIQGSISSTSGLTFKTVCEAEGTVWFRNCKRGISCSCRYHWV